MNIYRFVAVTVLATLLVSACSAVVEPTPTASIPVMENNAQITTPYDETYTRQDGVEVIYFAGGCFWGLEKLMDSIPGVVNATSGYANGEEGPAPTYNSVLTGNTGYRETVRVEYNPEEVSLDALLFAYYHVIDPTVKNAQGNDIGTQYQTGIYYADDESGKTVERITEIVKTRYQQFLVEIEAMERFYDAEEYHQDYLEKNPFGYCHISEAEINTLSYLIIDPGDYPRPTDEMIQAKLTEEQYRITQQDGTEPAFQNEYWDNYARGIYVDVVTGEPLFSSTDKYDSGTGWPSFTKGIDENTFYLKSAGLSNASWAEVRSRAGNSHLGHVFYNDPTSPNGVRYCIDSAALQFIPFEEMESAGYGYLSEYVE